MRQRRVGPPLGAAKSSCKLDEDGRRPIPADAEAHLRAYVTRETRASSTVPGFLHWKESWFGYRIKINGRLCLPPFN
jgi:hypothetical protein